MNWNTVKKVIKWAGIALGGLLGVIVIALVVLYFLGGLRVNKTHDIQVAAINVTTGILSWMYKWLRSWIPLHWN